MTLRPMEGTGWHRSQEAAPQARDAGAVAEGAWQPSQSLFGRGAHGLAASVPCAQPSTTKGERGPGEQEADAASGTGALVRGGGLTLLWERARGDVCRGLGGAGHPQTQSSSTQTCQVRGKM